MRQDHRVKKTSEKASKSTVYEFSIFVINYCSCNNFRREDGEELAKKLPLIQDPDLISVLLDQLSPPSQPNQSQEEDKSSSGLKALCQLSLGLALAALKRAPVSLLRRTEPKTELLDQDEMLVDAAIDGGVSML